MHNKSETIKSFKIVLYGDCVVGKSTLLYQFTDNVFTSAYEPTLGLGYGYSIIDTDHNKIKLQIWDVSGAETKASKQIKEPHVIIIAFDITNNDSLERILKWLDITEKNHSTNAHIVIAATKTDLDSAKHIDTRKIVELCKQKGHSYHETSAKNNIGVHELFQNIAITCHANSKPIDKLFSDLKNELDNIPVKSLSQQQLKINLLHNIDNMAFKSPEKLSIELEDCSANSKSVHQAEFIGFFSASQPSLSKVCDDFIETLKTNHNIPTTENTLRSIELINKAKYSIIEQFGYLIEDYGVQTPFGGSLFTGLFGNTPTKNEQSLRIKMIKIAEKYNIITEDQAAERLQKFIADVNAISPGSSKSIMEGKNEVLFIARDEKYPIWLIVLFCIPILGQIGFIAFKCIEACMPKNNEANEPCNNSKKI